MFLFRVLIVLAALACMPAAAAACDLVIRGIGSTEPSGATFYVMVSNRGGGTCQGSVAALSPGYVVDGVPDLKETALIPGETRLFTIRGQDARCLNVAFVLPAGLFVVWPPDHFTRTICPE